MAGSRRSFIYTTDSGKKLKVLLDESNYNGTGLGFTLPAASDNTETHNVTRSALKMRYITVINGSQDGGPELRRLFVGTRQVFDAYAKGGILTLRPAGSGSEGGNVVYDILGATPERRRLISNKDTFKTDGSTP